MVTETADVSINLTATEVPLLPIVTPTPGRGDVQPDTTGEPSEPIEVPEVYVVEEGDTLYSISVRFRVDLAALVEANNLTDPNDIRVGQELLIPRPNQ